MTVVIWIGIIICIVLAFAGLILPVLPGMPLMLVGFLIYHFFIDNSVLTSLFWWGVGIVTVASFFVDYIASGIGAKKYGASKWSPVSAALGIILFPFFLGPIGIVVGPFVMVFVTELIVGKTIEKAIKSSIGTLIGLLGGVLIKGSIMLGLTIWFVWKVLA